MAKKAVPRGDVQNGGGRGKDLLLRMMTSDKGVRAGERCEGIPGGEERTALRPALPAGSANARTRGAEGGPAGGG